jgi:hypothetical protein
MQLAPAADRLQLGTRKLAVALRACLPCLPSPRCSRPRSPRRVNRDRPSRDSKRFAGLAGASRVSDVERAGCADFARALVLVRPGSVVLPILTPIAKRSVSPEGPPAQPDADLFLEKGECEGESC